MGDLSTQGFFGGAVWKKWISAEEKGNGCAFDERGKKKTCPDGGEKSAGTRQLCGARRTRLSGGAAGRGRREEGCSVRGEAAAALVMSDPATVLGIRVVPLNAQG